MFFLQVLNRSMSLIIMEVRWILWSVFEDPVCFGEEESVVEFGKYFEIQKKSKLDKRKRALQT